MSALKAVTRGAEVHTETEGLTPPNTIIGTTTAVAIENCVVMYTMSQGLGTETERFHFVAHLAEVSSNVVIQWSRGNADSFPEDVNVEYTVYEFEADAMEQDVQRGENDNTSDNTDITITAVTAAQTMYLTSFKSTLRQAPQRDETGFQISLNSSTVLRYFYDGTAPETGECEIGWQVVEFKSADIVAQHGVTNFTDAGTAALSGFTTLANMFALQTGNQDGSTSGNRQFARVELDSTSQISFDHQNRGSNVAQDISWSVFEVLDGSTVEKGEATMENLDLVPDTQPSFTALDEDFAGVLIGWFDVSNAYNDSTSDDGDHLSAYCRISLDSGGAGLTITREGSNAPFNVGWVAIEWAQAAGAPAFLASQFPRMNQAVPRASLH